MTLPPLALLAGGLATRMRPLTEKISKSMLEVAGEPFIAHQLRLLAREHITSVVICAGYLSEQILDYVKDGSQFGVHVQYSIDWPTLLGTGGVIKKALPMLGKEFFVMYGDSYLDIPFAPVYESFSKSRKQGLMTVLHNENQWDSSNVVLRDGAIKVYDKKNKVPDMDYIDYGLAVLKAEVFAHKLENTPFDLTEIYGELVDRGELSGYVVTRRFYEIGSHKGREETDAYIRSLQHKKG